MRSDNWQFIAVILLLFLLISKVETNSKEIEEAVVEVSSYTTGLTISEIQKSCNAPNL